MNLAEASAALGKKDAERAGLRDRKYKLEGLKKSGKFGTLELAAFKVDKGIANARYTFSYVCKYEDGTSGEETAQMATDETVIMDLNAAPASVAITCYFTASIEGKGETVETSATAADQADAEIDMGGFRSDPVEVLKDVEKEGGSAYFTCELSLVGQPLDGQQVRTELVGEPLGAHTTATAEQEASPWQSEPTCHVKASLETVEATLVSIDKQLEEVQTEFEELYSIVQQGAQKQKQGSASGQKAKKKSAAAAGGKASASQDGKQQSQQQESSGSVSAAFTSAVTVSMAVAQLCVEHRAYLLFGAASVGIYLFGDYASV